MTGFDYSEFPLLETERLVLRQILPSDVEDWLAVWCEPAVMRYMIDFDKTPQTIDDVMPIIEWTDDIFTKQTGLRWAIVKKSFNKMLGSVGFHLYHKANRCAEIGYELHPAYWRQGIMTEALQEVLTFGFRQLNLHRIEANVTVGNEASANLLHRLGFTQEGTWRDKVISRGQFVSLWQFSLLEDEKSL